MVSRRRRFQRSARCAKADGTAAGGVGGACKRRGGWVLGWGGGKDGDNVLQKLAVSSSPRPGGPHPGPARPGAAPGETHRRRHSPPPRLQALREGRRAGWVYAASPGAWSLKHRRASLPPLSARMTTVQDQQAGHARRSPRVLRSACVPVVRRLTACRSSACRSSACRPRRRELHVDEQVAHLARSQVAQTVAALQLACRRLLVGGRRFI